MSIHILIMGGSKYTLGGSNEPLEPGQKKFIYKFFLFDPLRIKF